MSNPRPESRIKSLEQRATDMEADIIELASDMAEELRAIRQDIKDLDEGMRGSFVQIGDHFIKLEDKIDQGLAEIRQEMKAMEERIKAATKGDIARLEGLILQLLQQRPGGEK